MARDGDVYDDILAKLTATNVFTQVNFGEPLNVGPTPADDQYLCVVNHLGADELDDVDPVEIVRKARFKVEISVREEDPATRVKTLGRLANTVRKTLNGQSLGGLTLPAWTMVRGDTLANPQHPNQVFTLNGEFAYLISGYGGHVDTGG